MVSSSDILQNPEATKPKPYIPKKKNEEGNLQLRVCNYIRANYPHVIFCSDFAAGLKLSDWQRQIMMALRSDDGQPDLSIDFPSRGYHGLRIELKKEGTVIYGKNGKLRKHPYIRRYRKRGQVFIKRGDHLAEQAAMLKRYNDQDYFARFAVGYDKAIQLIDWYFDRPQNTSIF